MSRKPKSVKFYHPGIISLLILPMICAIYIYHNAFSVKYYLTSVNWSYDVEEDDVISTRYIQPLIIPNRKFNAITLDGTTVQNDLAIERFEAMVTKLSTSNDTLNGVKIQFSKSTSYKNMVDAIDICNRTEKDHLSYVIKNDELFAYINNNNSKQVYDSLRVKPLLFDCVGSDHVFVKSDTQSSSIQSILNVPDDLSGYGIKMPLVFALCALWICIFLNMFVQALRQIMHFS